MTIPLGFGQITHVLTGIGLPNGAAVTYGFSNAGLQTAAACATDARTAFNAQLLGLFPNAMGLQETICKLGPDETGASAVDSTPGLGTSSGTMSPPNVSWLITKNTALGGRRGRGRMFLPGIVEGATEVDGSVVAGNWAAAQAAFTAFLTALDTSDIPMVLLHDPATEWVLVDGQPRRVPVAGDVPDPTLVTSLAVSARVATQRRRLRS